jgi:hypothetical protein
LADLQDVYGLVTQCEPVAGKTKGVTKQGESSMKTLFAITAAVLLLPATALAGSNQSSAAQTCRAQRAQMGAATFQATYGTNADRSNAFGNCVNRQVQRENTIRQDALKACQDEQADPTFAVSHGGKTFEQYYGGGKNNALRNCVAAKSQAAITHQSEQTVNAAQKCRAQRTAMGAGNFGLLYGTGKKRANAFGRCVSQEERASQADDENAAEECKAEQADPTFPVSHGGKTFADYYGHNADKSDAFGKCVSTKAHAAAAARQQATLNAAQTCKGERAADPAAFRVKYGKNADRSDAFGRCVSQHAKD